MRKKTSKLLIIFIMSSYSMATTFCLNNHQSAIKASRSLKQILVKGEDVLVDPSTNCIEVAVKEYRRTLISKFMKMNFHLRSSTPMNQLSKRVCKFKLRKVQRSTKSGKTIALGSRNTVKVNFDNDRVLSTSELIVMEGKQGKISFNDERMFFMCDIRGKVTYVEFSLDQRRSFGVSTALELTPGQWMNIGSIRNELHDKNKNINLNRGLINNKVNKKEYFDYFLTVY